MSTSAAFSGAAAANSAAAQAAAHRAKVERCKIEMSGYEPNTATVGQMQSYADCVNTVYPQEMSGGEVFAAKAAIILALVGAVVGAWKFWKEDGDLEGAALGALIGAMAVPFVAACIVGAVVGLWWVLS